MQKLLFLGTCAADFSAKLSGECADRFDADARRASCALFDGHFMIDCGPHCLDSLRIAACDPAQITDVFVTHLHDDHFDLQNLAMIAAAGDRVLHVWVREDADLPPIERVVWKKMKLYHRYAFADGYTVTGVDANHDQSFYPQWLLLEHDGKKLLYATDGGWFIHAAYCYLQNAKLDCMVLDATCGDYLGDYRMGEHNSIPMIRLMLPSLCSFGVIDADTKVVLTHIAPSLHQPHDQIQASVEKDHMIVAYDGMLLSV